jgi:hypothetical protein
VEADNGMALRVILFGANLKSFSSFQCNSQGSNSLEVSMNVGKTKYAQIMQFVPRTSLSRIVARYGGDSSGRRLT